MTRKKAIPNKSAIKTKTDQTSRPNRTKVTAPYEEVEKSPFREGWKNFARSALLSPLFSRVVWAWLK